MRRIMIRTKFSRGSDRAEAQAVATFIAALDEPRQRVRPALESLAKEFGLNYLEILLCLLVEAQDGAAYARERELVRMLGPPLLYTFRRVSGDVAKRAIHGLHGIPAVANCAGPNVDPAG